MPERPDTDHHNSSYDNFKGTCTAEGGTLHWAGDEHVPVTRHGYLPFFSEFLKSGELFSEWVEDCPIEFKSNNAPEVKDVLGTGMVSVLCGHTRYQHCSSLYGDMAGASMLGINRFVSHDSFARAIARMAEQDAVAWKRRHLAKVYEPLLRESYVLDIDPTVKPIYGRQEGAEAGYPGYCTNRQCRRCFQYTVPRERNRGCPTGQQ